MSTLDESMIPPLDEDLEIIHERSYLVRVYRRSDTEIVIRGAVCDVKPAGLYIPEDNEPFRLHHMVVDLTVERPSMQILDAKVHFKSYVHETCPAIVTNYEKLIGLNMGRGFTAKVRELFGGPRGCAHTTALLQAMAPTSVQAAGSLRAVMGREVAAGIREREQSDAWAKTTSMNVNACHIWAEDGDTVAGMREGRRPSVPLSVRLRYKELNRDPNSWFNRMG